MPYNMLNRHAIILSFCCWGGFMAASFIGWRISHDILLIAAIVSLIASVGGLGGTTNGLSAIRAVLAVTASGLLVVVELAFYMLSSWLNAI